MANRVRIFEIAGLLSKERISSRGDVWFPGSDWLVDVTRHEVVGGESENSNFVKEEEENQQEYWQVYAVGFRKTFSF